MTSYFKLAILNKNIENLGIYFCIGSIDIKQKLNGILLFYT